MLILLDFDGTVTEHEFPAIGRFNPRAMEVIKLLKDNGHTIVLNSIRCNVGGASLEKALEYINLHPEIEVEIDGHTEKKIYSHPWDLEKALRDGELHIDDQSLNAPMRQAAMTSGYMFDWVEAEKQLREHGIIK